MIKIIRFRTHTCSYLNQLILALGVITCVSSCTTDPERRPSPLRLDSGLVGDVKVKIEYSSPGVKGREIFGVGSDFLVEFNEMWRTGANDASFLTLGKALYIDSTLFDSGSYAIFTIPAKDEWTVIFNKEWKQWGSYHYHDSLDVLRIKVPVARLDSLQERMRFFFENDSLKFQWDKLEWGIKLSNQL